jgi:poly-gamma-glutamate synthesis protein (capsule biosynthesis protein)
MVAAAPIVLLLALSSGPSTELSDFGQNVLLPTAAAPEPGSGLEGAGALVPSATLTLGVDGSPGAAGETSTPAPAPGPPITHGPPVPERGRLVINGVGDVSLDPGYIPAFGRLGYEHALAGLDGLFLEDDLTVINLECPASTLGRAQPKQFTFRCDVDALPVIEALGVEVASQGNNHSLDYGPDALLDSVANLRASGIEPVGAGADAAEAHRPAVVVRNGWTIAVVGFGGVVPNATWIAGADRPGMADGDTIETMVAAVEAAAAIADLVVVTIHWGVELQSGPPADDVRRAEAMIEAGADMIFGHHPHRLNSLELIDGVPVAWSLGNFVWPRLSPAGADSAVAQVVVEPDGTMRACLLDVTIVSDGHPTLDDPATRTC